MIAGDPENVMRRTSIENANYVIEQIRSLGLEPQPTSRLMRMQNVLKRGCVPYNDPAFPIALEALRDLQQLGFAFDQLNIRCCTQKYRELITLLLKDSALPQDDLKKSHGRDAQFELYLAGICQNAGLLPVDHSEPDVTCVIEGKKYGIAAKRMKNEDQLRKHIIKASDQIYRSKLPGIIAIELSIAWNRTNVAVHTPLAPCLGSR